MSQTAKEDNGRSLDMPSALLLSNKEKCTNTVPVLQLSVSSKIDKIIHNLSSFTVVVKIYASRKLPPKLQREENHKICVFQERFFSAHEVKVMVVFNQHVTTFVLISFLNIGFISFQPFRVWEA